MTYFTYQQGAIDYLAKKDPKLGLVIDCIGDIRRHVNPDLFQGLLRSLIEQQISMKAAETVWRRFCQMAGEITPSNIAKIDPVHIQKQGMTMRKAKSIHTIAGLVDEGTLDLAGLNSLSDSEVEKVLISLPGVGVWTAQMLMIFSLQRQDILSWHDLGIKKGLTLLHNLGELDKKTFELYRVNYSPHGSLASLYLWEVAANPSILLNLN